MAAALFGSIKKARQETLTQFSRVAIKVHVDACDIVHQVKSISLLHVSKPQWAPVAMTCFQVHLDIQLIDVGIAVFTVKGDSPLGDALDDLSSAGVAVNISFIVWPPLGAGLTLGACRPLSC